MYPNTFIKNTVISQTRVGNLEIVFKGALMHW